MNLVFDLNDPATGDVDNDLYNRLLAAFPTGAPTYNGNIDRFVAWNWNPVAIMPLDIIRGTYITTFANYRLMNPDAPIKDSVWDLTGDTCTLVGRFTDDGFYALVP